MTTDITPAAVDAAPDGQPKRKWIGRSMKRVEDPRLLTGRGGFIADQKIPGLLHAAIYRSPVPHGRIVSIDATAALAIPGVVAVVTGEDCKAKMNPCMNFGPTTIPQYPLAVDKVRYVGEAVVAVIAESRYLAEDGVDALKVEFEELPPVVDPMKALQEDAALLHEEHGSNLAYERTFTFGEVDDAFAQADLVVSDTLHWGRSAGMPLETTGAIARPGLNGVLEIFCNSMNFSYFVWLIATALNVPSNRVTISPVPAGGSFGSKFTAHKVPTLAGFLALQVNRPVSYIEDRFDHIMNSDHHASDRYYDAKLAVTSDGILLGLDIDVVDDYGAYLQFGVGTHGNALSQGVGPYRIKNLRYGLRAVLTNKCQQGAYRGFGSEVQNWVLERLIDQAAERLGMAPEEIRRKNFIQPDEFPYKIPGGNLYDSGDYPAVLDKALSMIDLEHWRKEQKRLREEEGRYIGIGLATTQERSVFSSTEFWYWFDEPAFPITSSPESATITVDPAGEFQVLLHSQAMWGNSPETVAAMVVAEEFGVDPSTVNIRYADSAHALPGTGPGGSRFTVMVTGAIRGAAKKLQKKIIEIAAHTLEVPPEDMEITDGRVQVKGAPELGQSLAEVALTAYFFALNLPPGMTSGLEEAYTYDHPLTTLPSPDRSDLGIFYPIMGHNCHIAVMEVDPETGMTTWLDYVAVHDAGTIVNPITLGGHVTGGTAQGVGTAQLEELVYDSDGQFKSSSFWEYLVPSATEVPPMKLGHVETPSPYTEFGIKGGGEGGRMATPAVISAAIDDALREYGMRVRNLPVRPADIVAAVQAARQEQKAD
ncbi:xanthine dehydrogenase family protein molybdopterin-binding subunit [Geodermatophilus ruber]|uniref:Xanthine dehydrogenase, molybdenum binding subunit apoprotein n=1 Tax=Geodermatophilus ruber TaxID=504800 RepID=A0A1I4C961_9ACTN|nr:xanthine dehydrogenase family protein molybdopterin-binding subunit [Geodermatophilus ruber]SFK77465.1 xanthine dehydrogenase, molybdenum binding subunit apoprotein [Geodermatophilus ruber]